MAPLYLRDISGSPAVIYSLLRVRVSGRPVAQVIRSTDSVSMDIATQADGRSPNMAAVATFLGGTTGQILHYDQGPGAMDETQATASLRPVYVAANDTFGIPMVTYVATTGQTVLPAGFATNRIAVTMAFVGGAVGESSLRQTGVNAGSTANAQLCANNGRATFLGNAFGRGDRAFPADLGVIIGTPTSIRVNEIKTTISAPTATAIAGGYGGAGNFGAPGASFGNHGIKVWWPAALSSTNEANVYADLKAIGKVPTYRPGSLLRRQQHGRPSHVGR